MEREDGEVKNRPKPITDEYDRLLTRILMRSGWKPSDNPDPFRYDEVPAGRFNPPRIEPAKAAPVMPTTSTDPPRNRHMLELVERLKEAGLMPLTKS